MTPVIAPVQRIWYHVYNMSNNLPSATRLIRDSWGLFIKTWNESLQVSIWFLYYGLVYLAVNLIIKIAPAFTIIGLLISLVILVFWSWSIIRLIETSFWLDAGEKPKLDRKAMRASWRIVIPLLWVGILQILVLLGSAIPLIAWEFLAPVYLAAWINPVIFNIIAIVLFLPLIYVGIRLGFAQLATIKDKKRGMNALAVSSEMVNKNWWAIFGRQFLALVVFGGGLWIALTLLFLILGAIVGPDKFLQLADPNAQAPVLRGIRALLEGIVQAAVLPLFVIFAVKLYKAAKRSHDI